MLGVFPAIPPGLIRAPVADPLAESDHDAGMPDFPLPDA
jgi:hypothetical protein